MFFVIVQKDFWYLFVIEQSLTKDQAKPRENGNGWRGFDHMATLETDPKLSISPNRYYHMTTFNHTGKSIMLMMMNDVSERESTELWPTMWTCKNLWKHLPACPLEPGWKLLISWNSPGHGKHLDNENSQGCWNAPSSDNCCILFFAWLAFSCVGWFSCIDTAVAIQCDQKVENGIHMFTSLRRPQTTHPEQILVIFWCTSIFAWTFPWAGFPVVGAATPTQHHTACKSSGSAASTFVKRPLGAEL